MKIRITTEKEERGEESAKRKNFSRVLLYLFPYSCILFGLSTFSLVPKNILAAVL